MLRSQWALRESVVVARTSLHETSFPGNHTAWGPPHDLLLPGHRSDKTQGPRAESPRPPARGVQPPLAGEMSGLRAAGAVMGP